MSRARVFIARTLVNIISLALDHYHKPCDEEYKNSTNKREKRASSPSPVRSPRHDFVFIINN